MLINEERLAHCVNGRTYLADKGLTMSEYKAVVRKAYGDLRGVKFYTYAKNNLFKPERDYWIPASYPIAETN